jgi:hypothetical protein
MIAWLAFAGMILVVSAGLCGAYISGFYDGVKDEERLATRRAL